MHLSIVLTMVKFHLSRSVDFWCDYEHRAIGTVEKHLRHCEERVN